MNVIVVGPRHARSRLMEIAVELGRRLGVDVVEPAAIPTDTGAVVIPDGDAYVVATTGDPEGADLPVALLMAQRSEPRITAAPDAVFDDLAVEASIAFGVQALLAPVPPRAPRTKAPASKRPPAKKAPASKKAAAGDKAPPADRPVPPEIARDTDRIPT